jgi:hypothetical protein
VADGEPRLRERPDFAIEQVQRCARLGVEGAEQGRQRLFAFALVAPQDQRVQQAVAERVPAQRLPLLRAACGKQRASGALVQVFADHHGIEQRRAVVEHQRRNLRERVVAHDLRIRLEHRGDRAHPRDLRQQRELVCAHHDLAHIR